MTDNTLKPDESIFRFLFASPARFVGECSGEAFYMSPAFPNLTIRPNPIGSGSRFVLSIRGEARTKKKIVVENYYWLGEEISALLGAFFGKLIQNLGHMQSGSIHHVPMACDPSATHDPHRLPFNSEPRKPNGPKLNLSEAAGIVEEYVACRNRSIPDDGFACIVRAAEFYRIALESFHTRPDISFSMFCSTLEALLPLREYSEDELYDPSLKSILESVSNHCPKGDAMARNLKARLHQIRRRVALFVSDYVPDTYFEEREAGVQGLVAQDREDLISRIKCAYDLRSKVLHTGDRSGRWYLQHDHDRSEIGSGEPMLDDKDLKKTLVGSLTITGMERVTSTVLRTVVAERLKKRDASQNEEDRPANRS